MNAIENARTNRANEAIRQEQNVETQRHNKATELLGQQQLAESKRQFDVGMTQRIAEFTFNSALQLRQQAEVERNNLVMNAISQQNANSNAIQARAATTSAAASLLSANAAMQNAATNLLSQQEQARHNQRSEEIQHAFNVEQTDVSKYNAYLNRIKIQEQSAIATHDREQRAQAAQLQYESYMGRNYASMFSTLLGFATHFIKF